MGRYETPPFKMVVENGRLVPATPYDQERLDSYRRGTTVNVVLTRSEQRIGEKKWHAAVNRAVKNCKTPWTNAEAASRALKLALGLVEPSKTISGAWMQYPLSLKALDDIELEEAVEQMFGILHRITGVDPEEWRKQTAHVGASAPQGAPQTRDAAAGSSGPAEPTIAPDGPTIEQKPASERFPSDDPAGGGDLPGGSTADSADGHTVSEVADDDLSNPSSAASLKGQLVGSLKAECITKLLRTATDKALTVDERRDVLAGAVGNWKEMLPTDHDFVRAVLRTADQVCKGELGLAAARKYLEGL